MTMALFSRSKDFECSLVVHSLACTFKPQFKAQLINAVFATVSQMFGGSSQLTTTAEHAVFKSWNTVHQYNDIVLGSSRKLEGAAEHLIVCSKKKRMLLKGTVTNLDVKFCARMLVFN